MGASAMGRWPRVRWLLLGIGILGSSEGLIGRSATQAEASPVKGSEVAEPDATVPEGARVRLEVDRAEVFLGENVLVHFILENAGARPFTMSFGGDYRGSSRALRFTVTAVDAAGQAAEDPDPSPVNFGGFGGTRTLKPGERFIASLPLMRYRQIERPGRYTIRASHDFGWKEGPRPRPVGELALTFRQPSAADAERVIARMEKLPTDCSVRVGEKAGDYADFGCLLQPVYLGPLVRRIKAGAASALDGLERIPTPEATAALIELAGSSDAQTARAAARSLVRRLPLEPPPGAGGAQFGDAVRQRLAARSFTPAQVPAVRLLAGRLLAGKARPELALGAAMLQSVGVKADAPLVLAALERALEPMVEARHDPKDNILDLPEPLPELLRAMQALRKRGFTLGQDLSGEGQILLYFTWLEGDAAPRPQRYAQILDAFGPNTRFPTREAALRSIPVPVPPYARELILRGLSDPDLGVSRAACALARKSGDRQLVKPLLELIATEHHEWLLREASDAASELGAGLSLLDIWVERLGEEALYSLALDSLQTVISDLPGTSSGRTDLKRSERLALRAAWKAFLSQHAAELRRGRRFKLGDPALSPTLFGRARSWDLPGGKRWPGLD